MKCAVPGCPGEMESRQIVHTFIRHGKPIVVEDLPAWVCPVCGYTVLDLAVLDMLVSFDPETAIPVEQDDNRQFSAREAQKVGIEGQPIAAKDLPMEAI